MSEPNVESEYLTAAEAGRILMVSPKTVLRWARGGRIAHAVTPQGRRRFSRSEVTEMAKRMRRGG